MNIPVCPADGPSDQSMGEHWPKVGIRLCEHSEVYARRDAECPAFWTSLCPAREEVLRDCLCPRALDASPSQMTSVGTARLGGWAMDQVAGGSECPSAGAHMGGPK